MSFTIEAASHNLRVFRIYRRAGKAFNGLPASFATINIEVRKKPHPCLTWYSDLAADRQQSLGSNSLTGIAVRLALLIANHPQRMACHPSP
jgi:hypothetical protein